MNAYTTTIKTENGQDVIIIIAQPGSPASRYVPDIVAAASPSLGSPAYSCSDDYEWSPSPQQQKQQRKKYQRKNRPTLLAEPYPRYPFVFIIIVAEPDPDFNMARLRNPDRNQEEALSELEVFSLRY